MSELKPVQPCPFCGSEQIDEVVGVYGHGFECLSCHGSSGQHRFVENARDLWNRRPVSTAQRGEESEVELLRRCLAAATEARPRLLEEFRAIILNEEWQPRDRLERIHAIILQHAPQPKIERTAHG